MLLPRKDPRQNVELRLLVKAGSLQETDAQQGLAHFVEHMAFKGTERLRISKALNSWSSRGSAWQPCQCGNQLCFHRL